MCEQCNEERERLTRLAMKNPMPCIVCSDANVVAAASWIPDKSRRIAAGGTDEISPVFSFCLCEAHAGATIENEKLVMQAVIRAVRSGNKSRA